MSQQLVRNLMSSSSARYFYEVALAGSFQQAAQSVGIAASAIHRQVGLLEDQLGVALLQRERGRGGVRLTSAGEVLFHRINRAMGEMTTAVGEIDDLRRAKRGKVRVGTTDSIAIDIVAPYLADFSRQNPQIGVEVRVADTASLFTNFERMQIDVLLAYNAPAPIGLKTVAEYHPASFVVMRPDHPLAKRTRIALAECAQYPLALNEDSAVLDGIAGRIAAAAGTEPRIALTSSSYAFLREAVALGDVISIQGRMSGRFRNRSQDLVYVPLRETLGRFSTFGCFVPASRRLSIAAQSWVEGLVQSLHQESVRPA